jgi:hypothetical protein
MLAFASLVSLPVVTLLLGLVLWDHQMAVQSGPGVRSYAEYFDEGDMSPPARILEGLRLRLSECGRLLIPGCFKCYADTGEWLNFNSILYAAFSIAIVAAWCKAVRRSIDPLMLMVPIYAGFYVFWPFDQATRYMLPVLPPLVLALWEVINRVSTRRYALLAFLILAHAATTVVYWAKDLQYSRLHQQWTVVQKVIEPLDGGPHPGRPSDVASCGLEPRLALMLSYELNYPIERYEKLREVEQCYNWLIVDEHTASVPDFTERRRAGHLRLLQRTNTAAARRYARAGAARR